MGSDLCSILDKTKQGMPNRTPFGYFPLVISNALEKANEKKYDLLLLWL